MRYGWLTDAALLLSIAGNDDWRCVASTGFVALRLVARAALCRRGAHKTARSSPRSKRLPTPIARIGDCPKRSLGDVLGGGKSNFLIRDIDGPTRTAASVESCQFVARRSPRGHSGSVPDVGSRLRRGRGRSHRWIHISTGPLRSTSVGHDLPKISIQSSLGSSKYGRMRRRRLPDPRPIPEGVREPICPHKK